MKESRYNELKNLVPHDLKTNFTGIANGRYGDNRDLYARAESLTAETLSAINSFYHSINGIDGMSVSEKDGSISQSKSDGLKQIYDKMGVQYEETEYDLNIKSSYERSTIEKNKLAKIYEQVKGKVKNSFTNLKGFFKGKESEKNIEQDSNIR